MKKHSLSNKGLSLSQAQSISNLCNQRAKEIDAKLEGINNYNKTVQVGAKTHTTVKGKPLPEDIVTLLIEKSNLHACQAFLMENIKTKDTLIQNIKRATANVFSVIMPERPDRIAPILIDSVTEDFGWEQLTVDEIAEFTQAEAFAAHIGQFIHKNGILDRLRSELPTIPAIEWMIIKDGEKSPVEIHVHHSAPELLKKHEELAALHREHEQRVNYFKAKVKNLTTEENARIAKLNADAQNIASKQNKDAQEQFTTLYRNATEEINSLQVEFEKQRQAQIKEVVAFRIDVDRRFQPTVDIFLKSIITSTQE